MLSLNHAPSAALAATPILDQRSRSPAELRKYSHSKT